MEIKEVLRYLGYENNSADEVVVNRINECISLIPKNFKCTYKIFDMNIDDNKVIVNNNFVVDSKNLAKNLKECDKVIIFAATLGIEMDILIKKYSSIDMSYAVILQAVAAACIEDFIDEKVKDIANNLDNKYLRPRFSAGYGDFDISYQKDIINILNASKSIGLSVTDSFMLVPTKSVTAFIGISDIDNNCNVKGCELCSKKDCKFRRI